jgi:hypothetical protein
MSEETKKEEVVETKAETKGTSGESQVTATYTNMDESKSKRGVFFYVIAGVVVLAILFGVLYLLEKEGRSNTNVFSDVIAEQQANEVVAVVNGQEITAGELDVSIQQFNQAAALQGMDVTDPAVAADIRTQALEVLVNTTLLLQKAGELEIAITPEQVSERLEEIKVEIGGEEVLAERMEELGIGEDRLEGDIEDELVIQALLDEVVFAEADMSVAEEEVTEFYAAVGGEEAGLPPLEEIRAEVEAQIIAQKEQLAIDAYLTEIKDAAEVELVGEAEVE